MAGFDAIFDEGSDALVYLLPHSLFAFALLFDQFPSQLQQGLVCYSLSALG
jgi:hypothetical protein